MSEAKKITEILKSTTTDFSTISKNEFMILDLEDNILAEMSFKRKFLNFANEKIEGFKIIEDNKTTLNDLFLYFHGNIGTFDLKKGIYLHGEFGCGKTSIMMLFSKYLANEFPFSKNGFGNTSIEEVAEYYKNGRDEKGNKENSIEKYVISEITGNPYSICLHEIGKEINEKYYGTDINQVINSLMMRRYEVFQKYGTRTHCTSNFHPSNLKCFDNAVLDRLKEQFNFVEWKGGSFRK